MARDGNRPRQIVGRLARITTFQAGGASLNAEPNRDDPEAARADVSPEDRSPIGGKRWEGPQLHGEDLRHWAAATAEVATVEKLAGPRTANTAAELAESVCQGAGRAIDGSPQKASRACHKGCPGCCHALISVVPPEAIVIADYLRKHAAPEEIERVHDRAKAIARQTRTADAGQYLEAMLWCPLLDSQMSCSVYPIRPIACRAWNSLSLDRCHECFIAGHLQDKVPLDEHAYEVGQGARSGFKNGLQDSGLDGNLYELNSALTVALENPQAGKQWVNGEPIFANCKPVG